MVSGTDDYLRVLVRSMGYRMIYIDMLTPKYTLAGGRGL